MSRRKQNINTDIEKPGTPDAIVMRGDDMSTDHNRVEPIDGDVLHSDEMEHFAFMEEPVTIIVAETTDTNAERVPMSGNNGQIMFFPRGQEVTCKRKFVDSLIVKASVIRTPEMLNGAQERTFSITHQSAVKYPFHVIKDDNPKGTQWLRQRIAETI